MKLKVLKIPSDSNAYLGLEREALDYHAQFNDDHIINQLYYQYYDLHTNNDIDDGRQLEWGVQNSLIFCKEVLRTYKKYLPQSEYQIVELANIGDRFENQNLNFLGFDIACLYRISLLSWGLNFEETANHKIFPLLQLLQRYFQPKLNDNLLFQKQVDAQFCLDYMMALQRYEKSIWDDCHFEVIQLAEVLE
ncbi:MAG TPA: hypothetical protein VLL52_10675 [Anaerolineae bacterium]|nr:hypothetical protein [Anaerolineae bacterium]